MMLELMILMLLMSVGTTTLAIFAHDRVGFMSRKLGWSVLMALGITGTLASMIIFTLCGWRLVNALPIITKYFGG